MDIFSYDDGYFYTETDTLLDIEDLDETIKYVYDSSQTVSSAEELNNSDANTSISDSEMEMSPRINVKKFSGYTNENAEQFISYFEAYTVCSKIQDPSRKVAAFQLHLCGPAHTWYSNLNSDFKTSINGTKYWKHLKQSLYL